MISNFGDCFGEDPFGIQRRIAERVRIELRRASDRKLRAIWRAYEKLPFYKKYFVQLCNEEYWFEKGLRANTARALLLGKLNWDKLERLEKKGKDRIERAKQEEARRAELLKKAKSIEFFQGSLEEFEKYKGEKYEIVKGHFRFDGERFINFEEEFLKLAEQNVEALVRYNRGDTWEYSSGVPVRRIRPS